MTSNETEDLIHQLIPDDVPEFEGKKLRLFLNDFLDEKSLPPMSNKKIIIFKRLDWEPNSLNKKQLSEIFDKYKTGRIIKTHQVPAYLASLGKITNPEIEKLAWKWAPYNVQVLLGLAAISDQEDKYNSLSMRFRLAQTEASHYWLLKFLPNLPLSLQEIAVNLFKKNESIKDKTSEFISDVPWDGLKNIGSIYKNYQTFLDTIPKRLVVQPERQKKTRQITELKRTPLNTDDSSSSTDEIITPLEEETKGMDKKEQLYDQQNPMLVDNGLKPSKITRFSNSMQKKYLRMQVSHIIRQKFQFPTDLKVLPLPACQKIFAELWSGVICGDTTDACLILSMLTVTKPAIWLDIKNLITTRTIREDEGLHRYYWKSVLDISDLKLTEIDDFKKNSEREFELLLPTQAIEILKNEAPSSAELLQKRISGLRNKLDLPSLSLEKIQFALRHVIKRHTSNHLMSDLICDASPNHSPAIFYASIGVNDLNLEYKNAISILAKETTNFEDAYLEQGSRLDYFGSQQTPQLRLIKSFFKRFSTRFQQSDHYQQFNAYTLWMWHIFLLLTSIRPVNHAPGFLNQIDIQAGLIWVSDKDNRTTASSGRFIPLCQFLIEAIQDYTRYLENFLFRYGMVELETNVILRDILSSTKPLLHLYINQKWQAITPSAVRTQMTHIFPLPLNWTRHFGRDYLSNTTLSNNRKLPIYLIDSIFGHEAPDQEALNPYSSLSLNELKTAAMAYDQMAQDLQLQRMNIDVI